MAMVKSFCRFNLLNWIIFWVLLKLKESKMSTKKHLIPLIARENKICKLAIEKLKVKCKIFEDKYKLSSTDFYECYQEGKMGDKQDFFEWKALVEGIKEWEQTKNGLKELVR